jgi:hypothetical protein
MSLQDEQRTPDEGTEVEGQMRRTRAHVEDAKEPEGVRARLNEDDDDDTPDVEGHAKNRRVMKKNV